MDEPGAGGACHKYRVGSSVENDGALDKALVQVFATISFQNGPIKESGVNGCHNEDLLAIVIHRLRCFQSGPYACRENALALTKIEEALHWLNHRTSERQRRGVEGTHAL
jgi:hypothetical protein